MTQATLANGTHSSDKRSNNIGSCHMKNVVARAMALNEEQATSKGSEAQEDTKEKDPIRAELLREIATVQIQTYPNNLVLGRIK